MDLEIGREFSVHDAQIQALTTCVGFLLAERMRAAPDPDGFAKAFFGTIRDGLIGASWPADLAPVRQAAQDGALRTIALLEEAALLQIHADD